MQATTHVVRWCLVGILVGVMLAGAAAGTGCKDECTRPGSLKCNNPPPMPTASGSFKGATFEWSCLGDASQDCKHPSNTLDSKNHTLSCCSCYLYSAFSAYKAPGSLNVKGDLATEPHVLLLPADPCTGVENWNKGGCPKEEIWHRGAQELEAANLKEKDYGLAINPLGLRGQHQMHVHLAKVKDTLMHAIKDVYKNNHTEWHVDCGGFSTLQNCKILDKKDTYDAKKHLKVQLFIGINNPAQAQPFHTVYGDSPSSSDKVVSLSTLVAYVRTAAKPTWAVVTNPTGPAESMLIV